MNIGNFAAEMTLIRLLYMRQQIVVEAEIADIIEDDILSIWRQTKKQSGITYTFF